MMDSRERVQRCIERSTPDRLPIRHQAAPVVNDTLMKHYGVCNMDGLLSSLGVDFREIRPGIKPGYEFNCSDRYQYISGTIWHEALVRNTGKQKPFAEIDSLSGLPENMFPKPGLFDYSSLKTECEKYPDQMRIFGYCEFDFINGISGLRGYEQVLMDIASHERVYLDIIHKRFEFVMEHIEDALKAADGMIDFVHFGDDLGSQRGPLISPEALRDTFSSLYREAYAMVHSFGAKTMLHCCGSCRCLLPELIDQGLDVIDVVQTNAAGMDIEGLKTDFGRDIVFCGSMCVQDLIPYGTPEQVSEQAKKRAELFHEGGLIYGPSHDLGPDSQLENIIEMYGYINGNLDRIDCGNH